MDKLARLANGWLQKNARAMPDGFYPWQLDTIYGPLWIDARAGSASILFSVFCRFDEPGQVDSRYLGSNPYSGKWNHHISRDELDERGAEECMAHITGRLADLVPVGVGT